MIPQHVWDLSTDVLQFSTPPEAPQDAWIFQGSLWRFLVARELDTHSMQAPGPKKFRWLDKKVSGVCKRGYTIIARGSGVTGECLQEDTHHC